MYTNCFTEDLTRKRLLQMNETLQAQAPANNSWVLSSDRGVCQSLHNLLKATGTFRIIDAQSSDQAKSERIRFQFCHGWQNSFANPDIHKDTALNLCVLAQLSARMQMPKNGPSHLWIYIFVSDVVNPVIRYNLLLGIVFMIGSITVSF